MRADSDCEDDFGELQIDTEVITMNILKDKQELNTKKMNNTQIRNMVSNIVSLTN